MTQRDGRSTAELEKGRTLDVSEQIARNTEFMGAGDNTASHFQRYRYTASNSRAKARDMGVMVPVGTPPIITISLDGEVGGELGAPTLFVKFRTTAHHIFRLERVVRQPRTDVYVNAGMSDARGNALSVPSAIYSGVCPDTKPQNWNCSEGFPPGLYYISISTQSFQKLPYEVRLTITNP